MNIKDIKLPAKFRLLDNKNWWRGYKKGTIKTMTHFMDAQQTELSDGSFLVHQSAIDNGWVALVSEGQEKKENNEMKVLTTVGLLRHIADNIEKNGEWVNDLEFHHSGGWHKTRYDHLSVITNHISKKTVYRIKPQVTYKIGERFVLNNSGDVYILSQTTGNCVALISLRDGIRWEDPIEVESPVAISEHEFQKISDRGDFSKVEQ